MQEKEVVIDIDSPLDHTITTREPRGSDCFTEGENLVKIVNGVSPNSGKNSKKEKRKAASGGKKHPKPPRPPRGLSLDAADQKLIQEISELAMIKRARIERMKALKKTKAIKVSATSSGNFIAMLFTVLFCIVIIFQGCHSSGVSTRTSSAIVYPGSPNSNEASPSNMDLTTTSPQNNVGSPYVMELVSGSNNKNRGRRMLDK